MGSRGILACIILAMGAARAAGPAPGISPDEGLLSYWGFQGTTDDVAAAYENASGVSDDDLIAQGGRPRYVCGMVGQAIAIGVEGGDPLWLNAPQSEDIDLGAIYTIEARIYPTLLNETWQRLVLRWEPGAMHYHFALNLVGGRWTVSLYHRQANGAEVNIDAGEVLLEERQHIAAVADGEFLRVYLDGREVDAVPYDGTIHRGTGEGLGIGDSATALSTIRCNGLIDELAIWNVPLAPEEILSHYEAGPDGYGIESAPAGPTFIRGDTDGNGSYTIGDGIQIPERLFAGRAAFASDCDETGDVDGDGVFTIGDAIRLFNYLFAGGPQPAPPANACGTARIRLGCKKSTCVPPR